MPIRLSIRLSICLSICLPILTPVLLAVLTPILGRIAAAALAERQRAKRGNHESGNDIGQNFAHQTSPLLIP